MLTVEWNRKKYVHRYIGTISLFWLFLFQRNLKLHVKNHDFQKSQSQWGKKCFNLITKIYSLVTIAIVISIVIITHWTKRGESSTLIGNHIIPGYPGGLIVDHCRKCGVLSQLIFGEKMWASRIPAILWIPKLLMCMETLWIDLQSIIQLGW